MAELYRVEQTSDPLAKMFNGSALVPVGYTEDDVRRLVQLVRDRGHMSLSSETLAPFRALLDGGDRAKA